MTNQKEQLDFLSRCLDDPDDPKNQQDLAAFRAASAANEQFYLETYRIWLLSAKAQRLSLIDPKQSVARLRAKLPGATLFKFPWKFAVAASLLLIAGMLWMYSDTKQPLFITYTSNQITPDSLFLPDGSTVVLARGASIRYPEQFDGEERKISLLKGMALFVVAKDTTKPFRIRIDSAEVKVLGTSFNIAKTAKTIQVSVRSGQVLFTNPAASSSYQLSAGQAVTFDLNANTGKLMQTKNADAWVTKRLVFVDAPLEEVCRQLSEYFQTDVIPRNKNPRIVRKLNASFEGESLEGVLELIKQTYPVKITRERNQSIIISY